MGEKFNDKIIWISGASQGIGRGIAEYFANENAVVIIADVKQDVGEQLVAMIRRRGGKAVFSLCDVNDEISIKKSISDAYDLLGRLDIVVNNAGVNIIKNLHEYSSAEWDWQMGVNVKAIFLSFKYAYPFLKKQEHSYIVNLASVSSFVAQAKTPGYIASKGAVLMLTKSIAVDYAAEGIRCNAVCPGITDTPLLREHVGTEELLAQRLKRVPSGKILSPSDIAKTVGYLSCEDSVGVTGTSILIDGGYLATAEWDGGTRK